MKSFFNSLATVTKPTLEPIMSGWVTPDSIGVLILESDDDPMLIYGDAVRVELLGPREFASVNCSFLGREGFNSLFSAPSNYNIEKCRRSDVRRRGLVQHAKWLSPEGPMDVEVTDVSKGGLGFYSPVVIPVGCAVKMGIVMPENPDIILPIVGLTKHLARNPRNFEEYRVGIEIVEISRADRNRWDLLLES